MPRRGVRNEPSPASFVEKRHAQALQLEKDLPSNAPDSSAANKIRVPLCECLSDVLLTDPNFSRQHGVVDRLWRHCFYSRIHFLRSQLMKLTRKKLPTDKVQRTLTEFLAESVGLYDYLIDKLQVKLLGSQKAAAGGTNSTKSSILSSQLQHNDDQSSAAWSKEDSSMPLSAGASESTAGIVECLHRLYVQLGDLYRYSESFKKAEVSYQRAALLGPGHGHAMNQLAVVLSSKDAAGQRAVALYWYARSLSVTTAPFATARSNLSRLHDSNKQWLAEQPPAGPLTTETNNNNKSMQSRRFLAQYCQLQEAFFRGLTLARTVAPDAECLHRMQECRLAFRQLLQLQALGDGLLCKLVTIQAFSECFLDHDNATDANRQEVVQTTGVVARTFTLQLGTELANRYTRQNSSLRLVMPLLLLAEYVWTRPLQPSDRPEWKVVASAHDEAADEFWNSVVQVLNQLHPLGQQYGATGNDTTVDNTESTTMLTEYQHLRGFAPFDSFLPKIAEGGVLPDDEAIEVLQAAKKTSGKVSSHPETASTTTNSTTNNNADQNRLKLKHFLALGEKWKMSKSKTRFNGGEINWDGGRYSFVGTKQVISEDVVMDDTSNRDEMMKEALAAPSMLAPPEPVAVEPIPQQSPVVYHPAAQQSPLVYNQAPGGGPALLVPTALLQSAPMVSAAPMESVAMETEHVNFNYSMKQPELGSFAVGVAAAASERGDPIMQSPLMDKIEVTPKKTVQPPPGFGAMQPPRSMAPQGAALGGHFTLPHQQFAPLPPDQTPFYNLFGGSNALRTANPFADPYNSPYGNSLLYPPTGNMLAFSAGNSHDIFSQHDTMEMDGTSLLDSGLLSSLLMDDQPRPTKNPFAMT